MMRPRHGRAARIPVSLRLVARTPVRRSRPILLSLLVTGLAACGPSAGEQVERAQGEPRPVADLLLRNGRLVTMDETVPEAEAVAIAGDRILFVGGEREAGAYRGPETEVIDLEGRLTVPGFIEGHGHLLALGRSLLELDLMGTASYEDLLDRVAEAVAAAEPGEWIVGRGWHQSKWDPPPEPMVRGFQTHHALSAVSPDNPVYLTHASGHAALANAMAMNVAGVTGGTMGPEDGEVIKDADGRPTGIFVERAQDLIAAAYAASRERMSREDRRREERRVLRLAMDEAVAKGITTFHDAGVGEDTLALYREVLSEGALKLRLWVMVRGAVDEMPELLPRVRAVGLGDDRLTVRAVKISADGALGSRSAWLLDPYVDDPGNSGYNTTPLPDIRRVADLALEHGFQLCVHAIGDRANRRVLDVYEAALAAHPDAATDARFRIEHAQILHPADVPRFAELGVVAAMQGIHATSDGPWTPDRLGRARTLERAYRFRDLIDSGATVMNGTDTPVEDVDPIPSFHGAVTGIMNTGEVLNPEQLMTREEGLRAYTISAAYGGHEEEIKGSLTPGKLADIVVLSRDILAVPDEEILDARVVMTIIGGEIVYRAGP